MTSVSDLAKQREALKKVYPSPKWAKRVNLMSPKQVTAIYMSLKRQNKI